MDLYITWTESYDDGCVNGVRIDNIVSIDKSSDYFYSQVEDDEDIEIDEVEETLLCEFNRINPGSDLYCRKINVPVDTDKLYFLIMHESGGGGSYYEMRYIHVDTHKSTLLDIASDYFDYEDESGNESSRDTMLTELEQNGETCIACSSAEDCCMWLYCIPLN